MDVPSFSGDSLTSTDNFYKFCTLVGLFILLFTIIIPEIQLEDLKIELETINAENKVLNFEFKTYSKLDSVKIKEYNNYYSNITKKIKQKKYIVMNYDHFVKASFSEKERERLRFIADYERKIFPYLDNEKDDLNTEKSIQIYKKIQEINLKTKIIEIKYKRIIYIKWFRIIGIFLGALMTIYFGILWYFKIQIPTDILLHNQVSNEKLFLMSNRQKNKFD